MNNDFEKKYIELSESTMPDMDKLWQRIETSRATDDDISAFEAASEQICAKTHSRINIIRGLSSVAAVFAVIFCLSFVVTKTNDISKTEIAAPSYDNAAASDDMDYIEAEGLEAEELSEMVHSESGWEYSNAVSDNASYNVLNLADTESAVYTALSRNNEETEYFVEADVLKSTELFIDCRIDNAEQISDELMCYSAEIIHLISDEDITLPLNVQLFSSSPYALRPGREYLIPVKRENGEMHIVFDNAPQIEITLDREIVCHNGWTTLSESGSFIEYPQVYEDDYFYDRMTLTAECMIDDLIDSWRREKPKGDTL